MSPADAIKEIEHLRFAVRVGLANSFRAFLKNISAEPSVIELLSRANESRDIPQQVLNRILELSRVRGDIRYLHRSDIALATYLWILSRTSRDLARAGADAIANLPRTWWAEQVSNYVLGEWSRTSTASSRESNVTVMGVAHQNTSNVAASNSVFFPGPSVDFQPSKELAQTTSTSTTEASFPKGDATELSYTTRNDPSTGPRHD